MSSFIHITNALIYDSERETDDIKQVILIDSQIRNHSEMVASVNSETFPILYSTTSERTDLLALLQNKFMKIERLGICFEMEPEKMFLNLEPFFTENECGPYSKNVRGLMEIMEEFSIAHLDFICDTADAADAPTQLWKTYFNILSKEGQVGFENSQYFVADFSIQQYLKPTSKPWLSGFSLPCSMAVYGEHLYVANFGSSFVSRVTDFVSDVVSDAVVMELEWKAFEEPIGLVVHGKYLYVSNYCEENGYISKINLQTMEVHARWFEDLLGPTGITVWEDYLYICDTLDNKIVRVNIYNPHDMSHWISLESPVSAVCYGGFMYVSCMRDDCILKISLQGCGGGPKIVDQWEIGNPVSIAISQKGLMYISCLYDACADSGNLIYSLDLVSGEFMENLDVSYNGVGSLLVHEGDLYLAEYLSFGLRKFPLPVLVSEVEVVSEVDSEVVSEIETWKEKEEYFREEMLALEEQRKEREEKYREEMLALELRLSEQHRKELEEKHREELLALEELRLRDLRLSEEEKHREELRVMEKLRLKEEEKHREELRLLEELRLRDLELRELRELREKETRELREKELRELREKELQELRELREKELQELRELREKELQELREKELQSIKEEQQREKELRELHEKELRELHEKEMQELREKELQSIKEEQQREKELRELREEKQQQRVKEELENYKKELEQQQQQANETWKDEIKKIIQHEFSISQTQKPTEKPAEKQVKKQVENSDWKDEIKKLIQHEFSISQTQSQTKSQTQNPEIWKDEIKKLIQNVIQSEISDMILPSLKNSSNNSNNSSNGFSVAVIEPNVESETNKETIVGVKSKIQTQFSNVAGFTYSGKPIDQIQKMNMKHV